MTTLKAFFDAGKSILTAGAAANAGARQAIRDVSGQLADELDRALLLADSCLGGARYCRDDGELVPYLQALRGKLMTSFHEHQVCAALYQLADRFQQMFDPTRFAVSAGAYREIPELIDHLKNGERAVIDDLDEGLRQLDDLAWRLSSASPAQVVAVRQEITAAIAQQRAGIASHRQAIRTLRRQLVDGL